MFWKSTKCVALAGVLLAMVICAMGATGIRVNGENFIVDGSIKPRSWSTQSGDEMPLSLQVHPVDEVFNFYVSSTTVPPATGIWDVYSPRANGVITAIYYRVNTNGSETNNSDVVNVQLNGTDKCTDMVVRGDGSGMTEDTWVAATITGGSFAFTADDVISVDWTNANTSDATGLDILIRGYVTGD